MTSAMRIDRTSLLAAACAATLVATLAACGGDGPTRPGGPVDCGGVATTPLTLAPLEGRVVSGTEVACFALAGGASYLVAPQLTGAALPYGGYGFRIGDPDAEPEILLREELVIDEPTPTARERLDARLRAHERSARTAVRRANTPRLMASALPDPGSVRRFSVLNTLAVTPTFSAVDAALRYSGAHVLLYLDTLANARFTAAELEALGALYDGALAPATFAAFGAGSDIDANGRVIFLLTPTVNAMVSANDCPITGYVRGFFYGHDLASAEATSNQGEIFYGYVPDPTGTWSCAHTSAEVAANLPPTFMHELQHMISYGEHVIERGGAPEEPWLNEGLSHAAEEIGSLYYETRFPAPLGRTDPAQLLPDSANPFLTPNLLYSHRFLFTSGFYSLTSCAPGTFCSLSERGGTWLMLRWVADRSGADTFRRLVETSLTGRANLEAVAGVPTAAILGDFALAVNADSIVGVARSAIPERYRFATRTLRRYYRALYDAYGIPGGVSRPFPIEPIVLRAAEARTGTMRAGTFLTYRLDATTVGTARLGLAAPDGSAFPASAGAQVSILRLP